MVSDDEKRQSQRPRFVRPHTASSVITTATRDSARTLVVSPRMSVFHFLPQLTHPQEPESSAAAIQRNRRAFVYEHDPMPAVPARRPPSDDSRQSPRLGELPQASLTIISPASLLSCLADINRRTVLRRRPSPSVVRSPKQ